LPRENFSVAKSSDDIKVLDDSQPASPWQLDLNTTRAPFSDLNLCRAFRHAVDAAAGLKSVFFGACQVAGGPLSSSPPLYDPAFENAYP
jgi:peptide/nickel transport system substrate-binding protein